MILFTVGVLFFNAILWLGSQHLLFADYGEGFSGVSQTPYEVILFGDSRVAALAQTGIHERAMNFAYPSDTLQDTVAKLLYCLERGEGLKVVLLQADDHMLDVYRLQMNNRKRVVRFSSLPAYRASYGGRAHQYIWERYVENYLPVVALDRSKLFQRAIHGSLKTWLRQGLLGAETQAAPVDDWSRLSAAERRQRAEKRIRTLYSTEQSFTLQKALRMVVKIGREHGIRILGIKYPLTPEYRGLAEAGFKGQRVDEILRAEGIEVKDFSALYDTNPEFFKDEDHLNSRGASVFAQQLSVLINQHLGTEEE